jgi:hydroxymethylbilane synthase
MSDSPSIIIGTRGSELALAQAVATEHAVGAAFPGMVMKRNVIRTTGDRRTDVALSEVAKSEGFFDKGIFTKELEMALDSLEIDLAVHSLKDVPTVLEDRYAIVAVLPRAGVRDVLVSREGYTLETLPQGSTVGTSSVRRARQLQWLRPDVQVTDLRGNVPTRLKKLAAGNGYEAILLAEAGMVRLGYLPEISNEEVEAVVGDDRSLIGLMVSRLAEDVFYPAAGQGAIGFEVRADDARSREIAEAIGHRETWLRITAEREFLRLLAAGCSTPIGVYSSIENDEIFLSARVFPEQGGEPQIATISSPADEPYIAALLLFESLA